MHASYHTNTLLFFYANKGIELTPYSTHFLLHTLALFHHQKCATLLVLMGFFFSCQGALLCYASAGGLESNPSSPHGQTLKIGSL